MSKQHELNRGYPQADPNAKTPPKGLPLLAIVVVGLGLIAAFIVAGPAVAWLTGS